MQKQIYTSLRVTKAIHKRIAENARAAGQSLVDYLDTLSYVEPRETLRYRRRKAAADAAAEVQAARLRLIMDSARKGAGNA